jgi:hypothetical protein
LEVQRLAQERQRWQEAACKRERELGETLVDLRAEGIRITAQFGVERELLTQNESVVTAQHEEELQKHQAFQAITFGRFLYFCYPGWCGASHSHTSSAYGHL